MRVLLAPIGSAGDLHPFLWLGQGLQARGHEVTVITSAYFGDLVSKAGLDLIAVGTARDFDAVIENPNLWNPRKGFEVFARQVAIPLLRPLYEIIADRHIPGQTVVVACGFAFGARIAQEKLAVPLATVHLQPSMIRSAYRPSIMAGLPNLAWMPRPCLQALYAAVDVLVADRMLAPDVNAFRAELGLPPVSRLLDQWWNSPQCVLGLFPGWFGMPQPDWPPQTRLTDFPLCDARDLEPMPPGVGEFLDAGEPPIVFTPGSAMQHGRRFFETSVRVCQLLGMRGLLLTKHREQLPESLPPGVRHFDYIPFSRVLPRAAAIVHHGGVGTLAQALAAGIPQLIVPFACDQPDNADRLSRLGVAGMIPPPAYLPRLVAWRLRRLLQSPAVRGRCQALAQRMRQANPLADTCGAVENLIGPLPAAASEKASVWHGSGSSADRV